VYNLHFLNEKLRIEKYKFVSVLEQIFDQTNLELTTLMRETSNQELNPNVSVDNVILGFDDDEIKVLLIERQPAGNSNGSLALPGNLIYDDETLDQAAKRVLMELTGISDIYLQQFHTFGDPGRITKKQDIEWLKAVRAHPEARVITVAYFSLIRIDEYEPTPSAFAKNAIWVPVDEVKSLVFDHNEILNKALVDVQQKLYLQPIAFKLLPEKFTLAQLQRVYEIILQTELDKRNFRRKILKTGFVLPLDEKQQGVAHKPATLYMFDQSKFNGGLKVSHF